MPKILIIDDDESFRKMVHTTLTSLGHEVVEACHGREGLRILGNGSYDLTITDLIMPEKEGVETILEIQRKYPKQKIIAMSGGGRINSAELLNIAGKLCNVPTLAKPFSRQQLSDAILMALSAETVRSSDAKAGAPSDS